MPADPQQTYSDLLALEGVLLDPARAGGAAEVLRVQLEVERKATRQLAFEVEPACFARTLHRGSG